MSSILSNYGNVSYFQTISEYLSPVLKYNDSYWLRCWHGRTDGFGSATFHTKCDGKGPTVTIVLVKPFYVFGGYTDVPWHQTRTYSSSTVSFLYSLYNIKGYQPAKMKIKVTSSAIYGDPGFGPTFGRGNDLHIDTWSSTTSRSYATANSYEPPPGCPGANCIFYVDGATYFQVEDIEVFYEKDRRAL
ncbi:uncharacterized protein LOC110239339 [Exaiptasia diaphana]|uniref:TLDc domain-containing protein n=1 Tax=Exaiptasia diaphana TaxID=2652724 RepID=A0A913X8L9_EXADI|nr:uncharacterized protein LOC110239339 [Exaiptasia diaphana]